MVRRLQLRTPRRFRRRRPLWTAHGCLVGRLSQPAELPRVLRVGAPLRGEFIDPSHGTRLATRSMHTGPLRPVRGGGTAIPALRTFSAYRKRRLRTTRGLALPFRLGGWVGFPQPSPGRTATALAVGLGSYPFRRGTARRAQLILGIGRRAPAGLTFGHYQLRSTAGRVARETFSARGLEGFGGLGSLYGPQTPYRQDPRSCRETARRNARILLAADHPAWCTL